jgi:hypothetical protein
MFLMLFKIALLLTCFFTVLMGIMLGFQTLAFDNDRLFEVFDKIFKWLTIITLLLFAFVAGSVFVCLFYATITKMI